MEETQEKLKALIEKAQKEKVDLRSLKAIKKRESFFKIERKFKLFLVLLVIVSLNGMFNHLFFTEKASVND
jgi:hypothetical protein